MSAFEVTFVGGGNMAAAMVEGLVQSGMTPQSIQVCDTHASKRESLTKRFGVVTCARISELQQSSDLLILAVKPAALHACCDDIEALPWLSDTILVSLLAGVSIQRIQAALPRAKTLLRVMPNTPVSLCAGSIALLSAAPLEEHLQARISGCFERLGRCYWLKDEDSFAHFTVLAGSGPGYFFRWLQSLRHAAVQNGLEENVADEWVRTMAWGAAKQALEQAKPCEQLIREVASKGGVTEQALRVFEEADLDHICKEALAAALHKASSMD